MASDRELQQKFIECARSAKEACLLMARNADPEKIAPRGHLYATIRSALLAMEGCCRQLNYNREDTRWIRLGILCARAQRTCHGMRIKEQWLGFNQLAQWLENHIVRMEDLLNRKTGRVGAILPTLPTDWLRLPDLQVGTPPRRFIN